jgi:hypothetical protein
MVKSRISRVSGGRCQVSGAGRPVLGKTQYCSLKGFQGNKW